MKNVQNINEKKVSFKDIIMFVYYLFYALNVLMSIYNAYIEPEEEPETCSCSVSVSLPQ